jgi:hypothetical protein
MEIIFMLTLSDINTVTNSKDGDIYSDLHKDVFGFRPRSIEFVSIEEFDADFKNLVEKLSTQIDEDKIRQDANLEGFKVRVEETMRLCNCDKVRAVEIIAEAEDELDAFHDYGYERLEWVFDLQFGSIGPYLETEEDFILGHA